MDKCQECGAAVPALESEPVGGQRFYPRSVAYCRTCGTWDGAVARHIAQNGPATAATLKCLVTYLRDHAGLPTNRLAALVGRKPEGVYRWMGGGQAFDVCAWAVVAALVADHVEGRRTTLDRLEHLAEGKQPKRVDLDVAKRASPDLREQQDKQRRAILKVVGAYVDSVTSEKRSEHDYWKRVSEIRRGKVRPVQSSPFIEKFRAEAAARPPSPPDPPDPRTPEEIGAYYDDLAANAPDPGTPHDWLWNDLRAVDERLPEAVNKLGRVLSDPERVRANNRVTLAARLAWEAGLEEHRDGETWPKAEKRITARYRKARG